MTVILERLTGAFALNCELFFLTLLFSLPLGLVVAFGSMSRCAPLRGVVKTFVWVIRGTPLMLQIIVIYLGPGLLGMTNPWPSGASGRLVAAVVAFAINYACYFSEIYRGGIEAVPKGQTEAGQVLGMTKSQIFFKGHPLAGGQAHPAPHGQRGHHAGEGHLAGQRHRQQGDHHDGEGVQRQGPHLAAVLHRDFSSSSLSAH